MSAVADPLPRAFVHVVFGGRRGPVAVLSCGKVELEFRASDRARRLLFGDRAATAGAAIERALVAAESLGFEVEGVTFVGGWRDYGQEGQQ